MPLAALATVALAMLLHAQYRAPAEQRVEFTLKVSLRAISRDRESETHGNDEVSRLLKAFGRMLQQNLRETLRGISG